MSADIKKINCIFAKLIANDLALNIQVDNTLNCHAIFHFAWIITSF